MITNYSSMEILSQRGELIHNGIKLVAEQTSQQTIDEKAALTALTQAATVIIERHDIDSTVRDALIFGCASLLAQVKRKNEVELDNAAQET